MKYCYVLATILAVVGAPPSVLATTELRQEITLIDCTRTDVVNGSGTASSVQCEGAVAPTVNAVVAYADELVISGTYDANRASVLRVQLLGAWYRLGQHAQLTAVDNHWHLDLSAVLTSLSPGVYPVVVEVETADSLLLRDATHDEIVILARADAARNNIVISQIASSAHWPYNYRNYTRYALNAMNADSMILSMPTLPTLPIQPLSPPVMTDEAIHPVAGYSGVFVLLLTATIFYTFRLKRSRQ